MLKSHQQMPWRMALLNYVGISFLIFFHVKSNVIKSCLHFLISHLCQFSSPCPSRLLPPFSAWPCVPELLWPASQGLLWLPVGPWRETGGQEESELRFHKAAWVCLHPAHPPQPWAGKVPTMSSPQDIALLLVASMSPAHTFVRSPFIKLCTLSRTEPLLVPSPQTLV